MARPPCPVVVMSGHGTVETAVEATRLGAVDFVEKPLSLQKLLRTVERALTVGDGRRDASANVSSHARTGRQEPGDSRAARTCAGDGRASGPGTGGRRSGDAS